MGRQNKGFLNLNRFKSGKAIKQQAKQRGGDKKTRTVRGDAHGQGK